MDETTSPQPQMDDEQAGLERSIKEREESGLLPGSDEDLKPDPQAYTHPLHQNVYETAHDAAYRMVGNKLLRHEVEHDDLTGLLTKKALLATADRRMAENKNIDYAMLFIDLDKFKLVNDTFGHEVGDSVLKDIAKKLRSSTRHGDKDDNEVDFDILAHGEEDDADPSRLGGDEFAIFVGLEPKSEHGNPDLTSEQRLNAFLKRIQKEINNYLLARPDLAELGFGASIGAVISWPGEAAAQMLARSDNSMYVVKREKGHHREPEDASAA